MNRITSAKQAWDYPNLADDLWVIWWGNDQQWPAAGRETFYMTRNKTDAMKGFALMNPEYANAVTFTNEAEAQKFLAENTKKRGHPYHGLNITTVAELKERRGYNKEVER